MGYSPIIDNNMPNYNKLFSFISSKTWVVASKNLGKSRPYSKAIWKMEIKYSSTLCTRNFFPYYGGINFNGHIFLNYKKYNLVEVNRKK